MLFPSPEIERADLLRGSPQSGDKLVEIDVKAVKSEPDQQKNENM
jgi:hypothetical protein